MASKNGDGLGKALIRRKRADGNDRHRRGKATQQAALKSIMDMTDLDLVLESAEEAARVFSDVNPPAQVFNEDENAQIGAADRRKQQHREEILNQSSLTVPRRPKWHSQMSVEELDAQERQAFLSWRRSLVRLEENEMLVVTPFEKNLEVWRQLWRVVERCHLVVMVVDARNPLFYRCPDLEAYVKETNENKRTLLLLNKADLLPVVVRKKWAAYFKSIGVSFVFWSAKSAMEILEGKHQAAEQDGETDVQVLGREELLAYLQAEAERIRGSTDSDTLTDSGGRVSVGFVGYPNVGKSSTINVLVGEKRTGVTSTPGKTKHFQTLIINDKLMLCDCPGLVFPSFTSSKSDMVVAGVLPVDKMTDYRGPAQVIANQIPRQKLESLYGLVLPKPKAYEDPRRPPTAAELLRSYAQSRGYVASSGLPDETRSARQIIKDYLSGKLLYCHEPPKDGNEEAAEVVSSEESEAGSEEDASDGESEPVQESEVQTGKLDAIFRDVDLSKPQQVKTKVKRAAHKLHKKTPRVKDRSWRVKDDDTDGMALVRGVQRTVSYGAAGVR